MGLAGAGAGASKALEEIIGEQMLRAQIAQQQEQARQNMDLQRQRIGLEGARFEHGVQQDQRQQREGTAAGLVDSLDAGFDPRSDEPSTELSPEIVAQLTGTQQAPRMRTEQQPFQGPFEELGQEAAETRPAPVELSRLVPTGAQQQQRRTVQGLQKIGSQLQGATSQDERRGVAAEAFGEGINVPQSLTAPTAEEEATLRQTLRGEDMQDFRAKEGIRAANRPAQMSPGPSTVEPPLDPMSQDIMSQSGLSYNAFLAATGDLSKLSRDKETRNRATAEVQNWARSRGMDISTFQSQFKAHNEVLQRNIKRYNNTLLAEGEIEATVANLTDAARESGLNDVRAINAAQLWMQGELNDPAAATYAMHLNQLQNDLAMYNAASQGRAGTVFVSDIDEAKSVIKRGMAAGSLSGLQHAITKSVEKMGTVLQGGVDRAQQNVWDLFGVGEKYRPMSERGGQSPPPGDAGASDDAINSVLDKFRRNRGGGQ